MTTGPTRPSPWERSYLASIGLVRSRKIDDETFEISESPYEEDVQLDAGAYRANLDDIGNDIRPILSTDEATRLIERFGEALSRPVSIPRPLELVELRESLSAEAKVDALRRIYAQPVESMALEATRKILEDLLLPELAAATSKSVTAIKRQAHRMAGKAALDVVLPDRKAEIASSLPLPDFEHHRTLGAFAVDGKLVVGASNPPLVLDVEGGIWVGFERLDTNEEVVQVLVVHRGSAEQLLELEAVATSVGPELRIERAAMEAYDAGYLDDREFQSTLAQAASGTVADRGVVSNIGGDGRATTRAVGSDSLVRLVVIDLT